MRKIDIIGAGLSGLYAACYLSKNGYKVRVFEKNESVGGRSRSYELAPAVQPVPVLALEYQPVRVDECQLGQVDGGDMHS